MTAPWFCDWEEQSVLFGCVPGDENIEGTQQTCPSSSSYWSKLSGLSYLSDLIIFYVLIF